MSGELKKKKFIFPSWMKIVKAIGDSRKTLYMKELTVNARGTYATITYVLDMLEEKGLIVRLRHDGTDREVQILLTERGRLVWKHLLMLENELGVHIVDS